MGAEIQLLIMGDFNKSLQSLFFQPVDMCPFERSGIHAPRKQRTEEAALEMFNGHAFISPPYYFLFFIILRDGDAL